MKEVALVTGASSGIGLELARIHAERGGDLIIVARRIEKLTELQKELEQQHGIRVTAIAKDLSKAGAAQALFEQISNSGIEVKYLINNAGFGLRGKFHELPWSRQQEMINLNMVSLTELMYLFLPRMVSRNSGKILNTSSTASFLPGPLQAIYFASKAYVTYLGNAISEELYDTNVTITTLMPGATETEFAAVSGMDKTDLFEKTVSARSVAEAGYDGMLKGKLDVVSGLTVAQSLMMKSIPFTPKKMLLKQIRKMQEVNS
ncbi:SDR family NAD(P)-dependent oxidoreductase [Poritiphilus flavus]|uniref:SDR family NAD(P)-dependent oxidoreductase n=1 Tax=Poritiphilus flavus TaxID=2697053 RepID=A0A6L9EA18_9FLAO|nr:SDR family oxidoreductase [Poritiphilus flavus]NAS11504.1 SDR family NAD(P)-dependent oxidoreductase [Poritiphilus flavus]